MKQAVRERSATHMNGSSPGQASRIRRRPIRRRHLVIQMGGIVLRPERRALLVGSAILAALIVVGIVAMLIGDYPLSVPDVLAAINGSNPDYLANYFVRDIRLPRVLTALLVGAALGTSGGIFQSVSSNALGSPDIIGFTTGAATGALLQIIVFEAGPGSVAAGALIGGFATALVVYVFAWRKGLAGYRLVLVGIGVSAVLQAVNSLLVVRASLSSAQTAAQWLAGSLNTRGWVEVGLVGVSVAVLLPLALWMSRALGAMVMGDDLATGLGVKVERTRLAMIVIGIALVSIATAATGPIAFVALAAPQIARKLTRGSGIGIGAAALMGAAIVLVGDVVAQRIFAPTQLPVGVVTGSLGGIYLIWLLVTEWKRNRE